MQQWQKRRTFVAKCHGLDRENATANRKVRKLIDKSDARQFMRQKMRDRKRMRSLCPVPHHHCRIEVQTRSRQHVLCRERAKRGCAHRHRKFAPLSIKLTFPLHISLKTSSNWLETKFCPRFCNAAFQARDIKLDLAGSHSHCRHRSSNRRLTQEGRIVGPREHRLS